jgi:hypothetical protein
MSAHADQNQGFGNFPSAGLNRAATDGPDAVPGNLTNLVEANRAFDHRLQASRPPKCSGVRLQVDNSGRTRRNLSCHDRSKSSCRLFIFSGGRMLWTSLS